MTAILDKHSQCVSSVHDLLAYGIWAGWCVHGRLCCPICMGQTDAYRLKHGKKTTFFDCHRCMLDRRNPLRNNTKAFRKGKTIRKGPTKRLTSLQIKEWHARLKSGKRNDKGQFEGYGEVHNWTHIFLYCGSYLMRKP